MLELRSETKMYEKMPALMAVSIFALFEIADRLFVLKGLRLGN